MIRVLTILLFIGVNVHAQRIPAASFTSSLGVTYYPSCDCVGSIDNGDWMEYNVPAGTYTVNIHYATPKHSVLRIGNTTFDLTTTGDWQNWTTTTDSVTVTKGKLRITCTREACNIDWIELSPFAGTATADASIIVFPVHGDTTYCLSIVYRSGSILAAEDVKWFRGVAVPAGTEYYTDKGIRRDIVLYCIKKGAWWPL